MSIATKPTTRLTSLRAQRASVRERMRWLNTEIEAHGNAGRMVRRQALLNELYDLKRVSESLKREIRRAETETSTGRRAS